MDYISAWCRSTRRLDGQTVIVTGCNTGIGKETAADLYNRGARVIMACRDTNKAITAKNQIEQATSSDKKGVLVVEKLDLSSLGSVRQFAERILSSETRIDILVNNAGVMMCFEQKTKDGFESHIEKVVDLDDMNFEKTPYDAYAGYCRSKAANVLFAKALAMELQKCKILNVNTYSLHPGIISTEIGRDFSKTFFWGTSWLFSNVWGLFGKSVKCGAQTTIYCAVDEACAKETGLYYSECAVTTPSKQCQDNEFAAKFWDWTIKTLDLQSFDPFAS